MHSKIGLFVGGVLSLAALALVACSGSDDSNGSNATSDGGNSGGDGGGSQTGDGGGKTGDGGVETGDAGPIVSTSPPLQPDAGSTCTVFPADNPWNTDISDLTKFPTDPNSDHIITYMDSHGGSALHPDFGSDPTYGIPYILVPGTQPKVTCNFDDPDESDPSPYPIPLNAPVEVGDGHVIAVDKDNCKLYEMGAASAGASAWSAFSGALFDLKSNTLRHDQFTSADAAGLPIYPGLVKKWEVDSGAVHHAFRVTMDTTAMAFVHPATHAAGGTTEMYAPPMGMRLRLKASTSLTGFTGGALVIATALQHYGLILADNGSNWNFTGETNTSWDDDNNDQLKALSGTDFEVVTIGTTIPQE